MEFVNIRELSKSPSKYINKANKEGEVVITRNGLPYAIISRIDGSELEDYILAKHFGLEKEFNKAKKDFASGKTINAHDLLDMIENE